MKHSTLSQKLPQIYQGLKPYIVPILLTTLFVISAMPAAAASGPALDIDFTAALTLIFTYASNIFTWLVPIAAIGIGFRFGGALLEWVGRMLGDALRFR